MPVPIIIRILAGKSKIKIKIICGYFLSTLFQKLRKLERDAATANRRGVGCFCFMVGDILCRGRPLC